MIIDFRDYITSVNLRKVPFMSRSRSDSSIFSIIVGIVIIVFGFLGVASMALFAFLLIILGFLVELAPAIIAIAFIWLIYHFCF